MAGVTGLCKLFCCRIKADRDLPLLPLPGPCRLRNNFATKSLPHKEGTARGLPHRSTAIRRAAVAEHLENVLHYDGVHGWV